VQSTLVLWIQLLKGLRHPRTFVAHTWAIMSSRGLSSSSSSTQESSTNLTELSNHTPPNSNQSGL
jgi:hypothetical protein